jgi:signal transduction histidine kinase/CheY-like chemotaxis protein/HPt (histidine-containing phosphotransfer) domain-containing protein
MANDEQANEPYLRACPHACLRALRKTSFLRYWGKLANRINAAIRPGGAPRKTSRWHLAYFALTAFDLLTVTGGLYLSHRIMDIYTGSVDVNQQWADRLARYIDLGKVAARANAPGNDIFDTRAIAAEEARLERELASFDEQLRAARADLTTAVPERLAEPLVAALDGVSAAMQDMAAEAALIFRHFRLGETDKAAQRMAAMDRAYHRFTTALSALEEQVREIQNRHFREQIAAAEHLRMFEHLIGGLIVLMVGGVTIYGYKTVRKDRAARQELEHYASSLAQARDEAAAASRAKSDFLAVMSHEIRTPMTTVLGMADLLAATELPEKARRHVRAIHSSGRHLLATINNVLDFSRIEAGGLVLEQIDFSLAEALEQVRSLMAPQAAERGLELCFEHDGPRMAEDGDGRQPCPPLLPVVRGDPTRLAQVLLNLVGNGLKFTPRGRVVVRVAHRPDGQGRTRVRFEVRDSGIGIPQHQQARLFEAFTQAEDSTTRRYGGTGLGLAISKRLVEAMGGVIGLESMPGAGSTFWFEVPLAHGSELAAAERVTLARAALPPLRVLVVEDVATNRELLGEMLGQEGHAVAFAENGAEAVARVGRERFHVVLMDMQMPVMDGIEATRRIRQLPPPACAVPVVALTANVVAEEQQRYRAAGIDYCLTKPVVWQELFATLAEAADRPTAAGAPTPAGGAREQAPSGTAQAEPLPPTGPAAGPAAKAGSAELIWRVIDDAERIHARLLALPPGSVELQHETHTLKGMAGLFGLQRICAVAGELQTAARDGLETRRLLDQLGAAIAAAREERLALGQTDARIVLPERAGDRPAGRAGPRAA